jgi:hypothetical protein
MHVRILPMTAIEFLCCFRVEILKEVFPDANGPLGSVKLVEEANYFVFKKKQAIRECKFAQRIKHMRNEDFLAIIQDVMYKKMQPGVCSILADKICLELGGDITNYTTIDASQCCALSELPNSWTIESPELFEAWCGSGFRFGNEQCDDGDLSYDCDVSRFDCPPVTPGENPRVLRANDGCNRFCQLETDFGWACAPGVEKDGGSGAPKPDVCACNCDCKYKCTCQDIKQRTLCRVNIYGIQASATDPNLDGIQCCEAL